MSRPKKATVDYFPHYCNHGKTIFTIESRYGNDGYAFWFKLLEILGLMEQHYIDCNAAETWEFLIAKTRFSEEDANNILDLLAKLNAINQELWEHKIIRSDNFINNLSVVYRRREVNVINNQAVLDLCIQKPPLSGQTVNKKPQSIVKYSKVKKSKVKESKVYIKCQHLSITEEEYKKLTNKYGKQKVEDKIEHARNYKGLNKYVSLYLTLNNWLKKDIANKKSTGNIFLQEDV